uniref:Uncharacterized protein n=1 Tax=Steinernema glaseri TaxID=37863 RepID=A0A1I7Y311_9BILA
MLQNRVERANLRHSPRTLSGHRGIASFAWTIKLTVNAVAKCQNEYSSSGLGRFGGFRDSSSFSSSDAGADNQFDDEAMGAVAVPTPVGSSGVDCDRWKEDELILPQGLRFGTTTELCLFFSSSVCWALLDSTFSSQHRRRRRRRLLGVSPPPRSRSGAEGRRSRSADDDLELHEREPRRRNAGKRVFGEMGGERRCGEEGRKSLAVTSGTKSLSKKGTEKAVDVRTKGNIKEQKQQNGLHN